MCVSTALAVLGLSESCKLSRYRHFFGNPLCCTLLRREVTVHRVVKRDAMVRTHGLLSWKTLVLSLFAEVALARLDLSEDLVTSCGGAVSVEASSTCGLDSPVQYLFGDFSDAFSPKVQLTCDDSQASLRHPAANIIDGANLTWWQSVPGEKLANVTLWLPRLVVLAQSTLVFRSLKAPHWRLLGSSDNGTSWQELELYSDRCSGRFSGFQRRTSSDADLAGNLDVHCRFQSAQPADRAEVRSMWQRQRGL